MIIDNVISNYMMSDPKFIRGLQILFNHKPLPGVLTKAAEELNELSVRLLQHVNKTPDETMSQKILEELVDAQMHIALVQQYFHEVQRKTITVQKIDKFLDGKDYKKFEAIHTL